MGGSVPSVPRTAPIRRVEDPDGGVASSTVAPALEPPLPSAAVSRPDPLFAASTGGPPSNAAVASVLHASVTGRIRSAMSDSEALLTRLGAGEHASRETFIARLSTIRDVLSASDPAPVRVNDHWTAPANYVAFRALCAGFVGEASADSVARLLWEGRDPVAGIHEIDFTNPDPQQREALDLMFGGARDLYDRFASIRRRVEGESPRADASERLRQTFEWLSEFPDLAPSVYEDAQLDVQGLPPTVMPGPLAASATRDWVIASGAEWHKEHRRTQLLTTAGLAALGIAATIVGAAVGGPGGAVAGGMAVAVASGAWQVNDSLRALETARTAEMAGIGSKETIAARTDDVIGASAGLAVNVLSAGLFARFGGAGVTQLATRTAAKELVVDGLKAAAIGGGTGLVATAMHPGVWKSDDTLGLLVDATITSAAFSAATFAAGKAIVFGLQPGRTLTPGTEVLVEHDGAQKTATVKAVNASQEEVTLTIDGADVTVRLNKLVGLVSTRSPLSTLRRVLMRESTPGAVPLERVIYGVPFAKQPIRVGETVQLVIDAHTTHTARLAAKTASTLSFEVLDAERPFRVDLATSKVRTNKGTQTPYVITDKAHAAYTALSERLPGVAAVKARRASYDAAVREHAKWIGVGEAGLRVGDAVTYFDKPAKVTAIKDGRVYLERGDGTTAELRLSGGRMLAKRTGNEVVLDLGQTEPGAPPEAVDDYISRIADQWSAIGVGKGPGRGHYWLWRGREGEGAAIWPTNDKGWDHNGAFERGPAIERAALAPGQVVDENGAPVPLANNATFGAHGASVGFQLMTTGRAARIIADQMIALNETLPPEQRIRYVTLSSCSQGDKPLAQAIGPTNAQRLQAAINQRLAERGVREPLTVLASDRPGLLYGTSYTKVNGRNLGRPQFIPAEQQRPEQFLTARDYAIALAKQAGIVTLFAGAGAAEIFILDALHE